MSVFSVKATCNSLRVVLGARVVVRVKIQLLRHQIGHVQKGATEIGIANPGLFRAHASVMRQVYSLLR